jgi:hypothetical protein
MSPQCAPDDDERQGTTEWIGLIGSNNRQEIRPLPCSFALLIASTRTLIADGKNASDQLQISLSLWYNYTFLARCALCTRGHRYRTCPWLCGVAGTLSANAHWFDFQSEVVLSFFKIQKLIIIVPALTNLHKGIYFIHSGLRISFGKISTFWSHPGPLL